MAFAYGRRALRALLTACASLGVGVDVARAQGDTTFPSRTVRILVSEAGGSVDLAASWLADLARVAFLHVPFRGSSPATAAVVSGNVAMMFAPQASKAALVRAGKLRVLGITSARRSAEERDHRGQTAFSRSS